tara:strand:+ start:1084 stop:1305 length:222 start_codon:yes stop_codon:yes gene_type:complete
MQEHHVILKMAAKSLFEFVSMDHEGLSADEQSVLKTHCKRIEAVANSLYEKDIMSKSISDINRILERGSHGKD